MLSILERLCDVTLVRRFEEPDIASVRIVAQKPDGMVAPLIWLYQYDPKDAHTWFFRKTISLPAGTKIVASTADSVAFSLYAPARR